MNYKNFQRLITSVLLVFVSPFVVADDEIKPLVINDEQLFLQAVELTSQKQWSQAELIYRDLIKRNDQWPEPGNNLAVLLLKTNRIDEAKQVLEEAVISSPSYRITQKNRSQLYAYLAGRAYDKALGSGAYKNMPEFELIQAIYQPVKVVEKEVEKIVIKEIVIEAKASSQSLIADSDTDVSGDIKQQLSIWVSAWSSGDFKRYIESYSDDFIPSDALKSYVEWKNIRRARLKFTKGVTVEIDQFRAFVEFKGDYALVEFIQKYQSDTYGDKVLKQMYMRKQHNKWLILSERTIKSY